MEEKFWHKSYAPGVQKTLDYEQITISEALSRAAKDFPEHTALNYMGKRITYKSLDGLVNRFARALQDLDVKQQIYLLKINRFLEQIDKLIF